MVSDHDHTRGGAVTVAAERPALVHGRVVANEAFTASCAENMGRSVRRAQVVRSVVCPPGTATQVTCTTVRAVDQPSGAVLAHALGRALD